MTTGGNAQQGDPAATKAPAGPRNTHFDFQGKVFLAPGAHFVLKDKPKVAMFAVDMGSGQGYISLKDLRRTFFIEKGSHDDALINRAEAGLHFVPDIRPGDEIPNEILDGTASWTVARRHKQVARDRLQVQLLSWVSGKPMSYAGPEDLKKIMEDEANKKSLKEAFHKAAQALGFDPNESEKVLDRIETLAREICYVEALRERSRELLKIRANIEALTKVYSSDPRVSADLGRIKILMPKGIAESDDIFNNIDAETADVMSALMSIDEIIKAVRKARDEAHFMLMEWDPIIACWQNLEMVRSQPVDRAISETYKFLAQRFATGKSIIKQKPGLAKAPPQTTNANPLTQPSKGRPSEPPSTLKDNPLTQRPKGRASEAPPSQLEANPLTQRSKGRPVEGE